MKRCLVGVGAAWFALLLAVVGPTAARASVVLGLELEEMTDQASVAAIATVQSKKVKRLQSSIVTEWTLRVQDPLKGAAKAGEEVVMVTLGGAVDGVAMSVEGEPGFEIGERALVFARGTGRWHLRPVGMAQGVMRIRHIDGIDRVFSANQGLSLVRRTEKGLVNAPSAVVEGESLNTIVERVRAHVGRKP
ncbi:MAG: hypothetical protein R3A47_01235 [Polyangiales bacterium]